MAVENYAQKCLIKKLEVEEISGCYILTLLRL